MPLSVDESKLYDAEYRNRALKKLINALSGDDRITGAVLVGSGATGFRDRYSDVDLAVLIGEEARLEEIYADWWDRLHTLFNPVDAFKEPSKHLYGFLLDRYMELDISFQGESGLYEHRPNWRILFDRRSVIPSLMKTREKPAVDKAAAHEKRIQDSWYYVLHCVNSIQREQPLRASFFISFLRDEAVLMAGLSRGLKTSAGSYFAETDRFPEDVKKRIVATFPVSMESKDLLRALRAVVELYYDEAERLDRELGMDRTQKLRAAMRAYLSAFS